MTAILEAEHLTKSFGEKKVLHELSFTVQKGEIFGFLGPSGAGKTTVIKMMTGQIAQSHGELSIFGMAPSSISNDDRKKIGTLTDNSALYERLTVEQNLRFYCKLYDAPLTRIDEVLQEVGLLEEKKKKVNQLSKGMKQRVGLARAVIHKPDLLFLDEPTSALDPTTTASIHNMLRKLNKQGTTIFLTTHDMEEATLLADRVAFLHEGKVALCGSPKKLIIDHSNPTITITLQSDEQVIINNDEEGGIFLAEKMKNGEVKHLASDSCTLGDIFISVTGKELI